MSAQTYRRIASCVLLILLTGCTEPQPDSSGFIEARLLHEYPDYAVEWESIESEIDREKIEPILKEAIAADGAAVNTVVDAQLASDFGKAINEQYEVDGQENNGIRHLRYEGHSLEIVIELFV